MTTATSPLDDWLTRLDRFSSREIDLGLERVVTLLERLQLQFPETVLHVAGTNGKGSCVIMLESLLQSTGRRIGCYTSPHMLRYNERIRVDGVDAGDEQIVRAFEHIESVRNGVSLTYFEFGTLAALLVFIDAAVDIAILEVGMGGRLDAVNAVEPSAGLITNVALDHCEWLGNDVDAIAIEKAGIMRAAKPCVFASLQRPRSIDAQAQVVGADLLAAGRDYRWSIDQDRWSWQGLRHRLSGLRRPSLAGSVQIENAAGVLTLLEAAGFDELLDDEVVNAALAGLHLPGRMQRLATDRIWLLDVAHNPAAAAVLGQHLRESRSAETAGVEKTVAIIGMLDDKDVEGVTQELQGAVGHWIAVTAASSRAIPATELGRRIANATNKPCLTATSYEAALDHARDLTGSEDRIVVTGSFYVVGPVLELL